MINHYQCSKMYLHDKQNINGMHRVKAVYRKPFLRDANVAAETPVGILRSSRSVWSGVPRGFFGRLFRAVCGGARQTQDCRRARSSPVRGPLRSSCKPRNARRTASGWRVNGEHSHRTFP